MTSNRSVAFVSGQGGAGKTTISIAVAALWARKHGSCTLLDTNTGKKVGGAVDRLDKVDPEPEGLTWGHAKPSALAKAIESVNGLVVVDTTPQFTDDEKPDRPKPSLAKIVAGVTATVVLGEIDDYAEISEGVRTVQGLTDNPVGIVFTRTQSVTASSSYSEGVSGALSKSLAPVLGMSRDYRAVKRAKNTGVLPVDVADPRAVADFEGIANNIDTWLKKAGL